VLPLRPGLLLRRCRPRQGHRGVHEQRRVPRRCRGPGSVHDHRRDIDPAHTLGITTALNEDPSSQNGVSRTRSGRYPVARRTDSIASPWDLMVHLPPSSSPREAPRLLGLGLQLLGQPGHRHRGADRTSSGREPQPRQPVTTARPSGGATPGRPIRRKPPQVGPLQAAPAGPTRTARASAGAGDRDAPPTTSIRSIKSTRPEPWKGARRRPCRRAAKRAKRPSWRCSCRSISVKQRMRYLTSAVVLVLVLGGLVDG